MQGSWSFPRQFGCQRQITGQSLNQRGDGDALVVGVYHPGVAGAKTDGGDAQCRPPARRRWRNATRPPAPGRPKRPAQSPFAACHQPVDPAGSEKERKLAGKSTAQSGVGGEVIGAPLAPRPRKPAGRSSRQHAAISRRFAPTSGRAVYASRASAGASPGVTLGLLWSVRYRVGATLAGPNTAVDVPWAASRAASGNEPGGSGDWRPVPVRWRAPNGPPTRATNSTRPRWPRISHPSDDSPTTHRPGLR